MTYQVTNSALTWTPLPGRKPLYNATVSYTLTEANGQSYKVSRLYAVGVFDRSLVAKRMTAKISLSEAADHSRRPQRKPSLYCKCLSKTLIPKPAPAPAAVKPAAPVPLQVAVDVLQKQMAISTATNAALAKTVVQQGQDIQKLLQNAKVITQNIQSLNMEIARLRTQMVAIPTLQTSVTALEKQIADLTVNLNFILDLAKG